MNKYIFHIDKWTEKRILKYPFAFSMKILPNEINQKYQK